MHCQAASPNPDRGPADETAVFTQRFEEKRALLTGFDFPPFFINTDMTGHAALVARSCVTLSVVITGFLDD